MIKRAFFTLVVLLFSIYSYSKTDTLVVKFKNIDGVLDVTPMESKEFNHKYQIIIEQPIDHSNPSLGTFSQRVFLMNISQCRPTVLVTEGYGARHVLRSTYREELSKILDANIIFVEHRYFLESTPKNLDWKYLTAKNAAYDLHRIREIFAQLYQGKWIATGISKGGQNALIYTAYFPNDVDVTVPYVAPLCRSREDGRHEKFLSSYVGTKSDRQTLEDLQREILQRRDELQPKFDSLCAAKNYKFTLPLENIYDYSVLELPFAFWQWGSDISKVPSKGSCANEIFNYWMTISSPDYFIHETDTTPFFVQASRELGYYGYDTKPFKGLLTIRSSKGYLNKIFVPEQAQFKFDRSLYKKLKRFVAKTDSKIMFIYGQYDPWSAVMVNEPKSKNVVLFVEPNGSHRARISTLPHNERERAIELLKGWINK